MKTVYDLNCDQTTNGFHQEVERDAKQYAVKDFYNNAITFHPIRYQETATVLDLIYYPQDWNKNSNEVNRINVK
jgi:hypothetical protein